MKASAGSDTIPDLNDDLPPEDQEQLRQFLQGMASTEKREPGDSIDLNNPSSPDDIATFQKLAAAAQLLQLNNKLEGRDEENDSDDDEDDDDTVWHHTTSDSVFKIKYNIF